MGLQRYAKCAKSGAARLQANTAFIKGAGLWALSLGGRLAAKRLSTQAKGMGLCVLGVPGQPQWHLFRAKVHSGRCRDGRFVFYAEVGFNVVAHHHAREVGGEAAAQHVVLLHGFDVVVTRDGDAVFCAF